MRGGEATGGVSLAEEPPAEEGHPREQPAEEGHARRSTTRESDTRGELPAGSNTAESPPEEMVQRRFTRPRMPTLDQEEYNIRVGKFWEHTRGVNAELCKDYGSAVGSTLFWLMPETQWLWDVLV